MDASGGVLARPDVVVDAVPENEAARGNDQQRDDAIHNRFLPHLPAGAGPARKPAQRSSRACHEQTVRDESDETELLPVSRHLLTRRFPYGHPMPSRSVRGLGRIRARCPCPSGESYGRSFVWLPAWLPRPSRISSSGHVCRPSIPTVCQTKRVTYHEAFWSAAAAAAPVLALANTVVVMDAVGVWHGVDDDQHTRKSRFSYYAVLSYNLGTITLEAIVLYWALESLLTGKDYTSGGQVILSMMVGFLGAIFAIAYDTTLRHELRKIRNRKIKAEQSAERSNDR